ncbi:M16 family metallopeptidase [Zavarzinia compransoris]|uniref:Peptidase M16 n=1 Tax=Zavarzinia compransoris TaxID=1264899 RepID=A0A317E142_9PROT|nr:pitrilysin family protein [Zavarzinia compransoris]PWR19840.1 peptidase M16 [Zavarzinia compransoris]TDP45051.1 putative Zn-dependent peptidase [Zavarzinia compransoris]
MKVETSQLDNGLGVLTVPMPELGSVALGVWVDVGARHETKALNGVSHMLEHMAFKGTERRSARRIAEEIEAVGGHLNAFTSREQTAYYARVLKDDVPLGADILADILTGSTFQPDELERERQVIIQEIGQAQDTPDDLIFDMLQEASYPDQPIGRPILGSAENVARLTRDEIAGYMADHYRAPAMAVVAAGAVSHEQVRALAEQHFAGLGPKTAGQADQARFVAGDWRDDRDLEQLHLAMAFPGVSYDEPDYFAAQVYATVLGGGMSSRLFQEIREVRGLAYSVFAYSGSSVDSGTVGIYAGTSAEDAGQLVPVIADEMGKLVTDATEEEVARARAQLRAGFLMGLESPSSVIETIGRQWLIHGRVMPVEEVLERLAEVDAATVRRFADKVMRSQPAVAALGPHGGIESKARIAARFG